VNPIGYQWSEIRASSNVTASSSNLRVEPNQIEIDPVRFDVILVITVEQRYGNELVFNGLDLLIQRFPPDAAPA
jgi:hypothetical protein